MNEAPPKKRGNSDPQQLNVRLALKATAPSLSTDEVSTEQLVGLRDGTLTTRERKRVLDMLDRSESCYQEWLALNRYLDDESVGKLEVPHARNSNRLAWSLGVAMASALFAVIVIFSQPPPLEKVLDQSYADARSAGIVAPNVTLPELFGDPPSVYDFASNTMDSLPQRSMRAGLWAGAATLNGDVDTPYPAALLPPTASTARLGQAPWLGTEWAAHELLGRWLVLVAASCQQSVSDQPEFWKQQAMIVDRLTARIAEDGETVLNQPLLRQLRGVSAPIGQLAASATPDRPCAEIRRIAERLAAQ